MVSLPERPVSHRPWVPVGMFLFVHVPNRQGELVRPQEATTEQWRQERDRPTNISEVDTAGHRVCGGQGREARET